MKESWPGSTDGVSGAGWTSRTARTNDAKSHVSIAVPVYRIGVESGLDEQPKTTGESLSPVAIELGSRLQSRGRCGVRDKLASSRPSPVPVGCFSIRH